MDPASHHLGFLLSLGLLPVACVGDDKDMASATVAQTDGETSTSGPGSSVSATSTSGPGSSVSATSTSGPGSSVSATSTSDPTTGDPTSTTASTTTGDYDDLCQAYAGVGSLCYEEYTYERVLAYCLALAEGIEWGYSSDCASSSIEYLLCAATECGDNAEACESIWEDLETTCVIEIGRKCAAYGEVASVCRYGGDPELYAYDCQYYVSGSSHAGAPCGMATEDFFACLTETECAAWDGACAEEDEARDVACSLFPYPYP